MHIGKDLREIKLKQLIKSEGYEDLTALLESPIGDQETPRL